MSKSLEDRIFDITVSLGGVAWGELASMGARRFASSDEQADALGFAAKWITKQLYKHFMDRLYYDPSDEEIRAAAQPLASYIYLFRGLSDGRSAWFYVMVRPSAVADMKRALVTGSLDVENYGVVLDRGWGQDPPASVTRKIELEYIDR
jgi:hypothetical protein